jgi:hypothetical protein
MTYTQECREIFGRMINGHLDVAEATRGIYNQLIEGGYGIPTTLDVRRNNDQLRFKLTTDKGYGETIHQYWANIGLKRKNERKVFGLAAGFFQGLKKRNCEVHISREISSKHHTSGLQELITEFSLGDVALAVDWSRAQQLMGQVNQRR